MIPIKQKHNHCFVSCLASCLMDDEGKKLQEYLVNSFSLELQKDSVNEGIALDTGKMEEIIIATGLYKYARHISKDNEQMKADLKNGVFDLKKIMLTSVTGQLHCWRIDSIQEDGLMVMEPMIGDFIHINSGYFMMDEGPPDA
jgi:hypothetical protein